MSSLFNVVFEGELLPGKNEKAVRGALVKLLKTDVSTIDRLFSGDRVVVRKDVDAATGDKYKKAFAGAGAVCSIEPVEVLPRVSIPAVPGAAAVFRGEEGKQARRPSPAANARSNSPRDARQFLITNIETIPGRTIVEHFGLVSGSTIRAKHVGKDILASFKNLIGGELKGYTELLNESRKQATERMIEQAMQLGANAVVNVRFSTSSVTQGAAELYAYGTAVFVE